MTTNLDKLLENIEDPKVLKDILKEFMWKVSKLEQALVLSASSDKPQVKNKLDRLSQIKHGITELTERMERPYIMPSDLAIVVDTLDILTKAGDCNSLIIEGMPGTGKTQLAYSQVGEELREGKDTTLIHLRVKDSMKASELLYSIDDVRRLSDAETKVSLPENLRTESESRKDKILNGEVDPIDEEYQNFKKKLDAVKNLGEAGKDLDYLKYVDLGELGEAIYQSQFKEVYLIIDEIEKGDEALMTGILDEIENLEFTIRETGQKIKGKKSNLKIIITTNTEDSDKIPPSFRRRSLYHFQNYPTREEMFGIVEAYFPDLRNDLLDYALDVFYSYHESDEIEKQPSTPELLSRLRILVKNYPEGVPDDVPYKQVLLKYKEDQDLDIVVKWVANAIETWWVEMPNFVEKALLWYRVMFFDQELNRHDTQDRYKDFYAYLTNNNINFIMPQFKEEEKYDDDYNEWNKYMKTITGFQIVAPWVQYLWDWAYIIDDDDLFDKLRQVYDQEVVVMEWLQYSEVNQKNNNFINWRVNIWDNYYTAYAKLGSNEFVVLKKFGEDLEVN